jgi:hypothetical protein
MKYSKKGNKEYAMVQLPAEVHQMLKAYCDRHGFKISGLISALVKQYIHGNKNK